MAENPGPIETVSVTVTEEQCISKEENPEPAMARAKAIPMNHIILPLTILSLLLSLPVLSSVVWLLYNRQYDCEDLLRLPKLQVGIVIGLIFLFVVSNVVVYLRSRFPVPGLLLVMLPLTVMLTVGLALVGAYKMESGTIQGSPMWLKMKVLDNNNNWNNIKSCIYDTRTCEDLISRSYTVKAYDFTRSKLSSIESGCCKPPSNGVCERHILDKRRISGL
ncbi:unnamed protein product [Ilex paraguariensis]|uniref:Tetraspanin-15 n=1 Tax=Ilex paraguariensis TaxID=185542 RepID=A0ABC8TUY0_9AQUA